MKSKYQVGDLVINRFNPVLPADRITEVRKTICGWVYQTYTNFGRSDMYWIEERMLVNVEIEDLKEP